MSWFKLRRSRSRSRRSEIVTEASGKVGVGAVGFPIGDGYKEVVDPRKAQRATNEVEFTICAFDSEAILVVKKWKKVERVTSMAAYRRQVIVVVVGSGGGNVERGRRM